MEKAQFDKIQGGNTFLFQFGWDQWPYKQSGLVQVHNACFFPMVRVRVLKGILEVVSLQRKCLISFLHWEEKGVHNIFNFNHIQCR